MESYKFINTKKEIKHEGNERNKTGVFNRGASTF